MKIKHIIFTRLMVCWSDRQILSDINNPNRLQDTQRRLDSRIKLLNSFYIPSMESQTNKNFENIFLIDRLHKYLDYSQLDLDKLNCKLLCLNRLWKSDDEFHGAKSELDNAIDEFDKNLPPDVERSSDIIFSDTVKDYILPTYEDMDFMISTRIDTDDAIQKNFINDTQNCLRQTKETMFIDYRSLLSAQVRNYSPAQIKTFKHFRFSGNTGSMMLSTAFEPKNFEQHNCYVAPHGQVGKKFKIKERIEDIAGLYLHWKGNVSRSPRLGTHSFLENTEKIKEYFPFLSDYNGDCNYHNFR